MEFRRHGVDPVGHSQVPLALPFAECFCISAASVLWVQSRACISVSPNPFLLRHCNRARAGGQTLNANRTALSQITMGVAQ